MAFQFIIWLAMLPPLLGGALNQTLALVLTIPIYFFPPVAGLPTCQNAPWTWTIEVAQPVLNSQLCNLPSN